jgi:signal transduction histidine kinase
VKVTTTGAHVSRGGWTAWSLFDRAGRPVGSWLPAGLATGAGIVALAAWPDAPHRGSSGLLLVLAVAPFAVVAAARWLPPIALVATAVPAGLFALAGGPFTSATLPAAALVVAVPTVSRRVGLAALVVTVIGYFAVAAERGEVGWCVVGVAMLLAWFAGMYFKGLLTDLRAFQDAGVTAAEDAVRAERRRLARELHDLVAHALTGTMLCLTEIRLLLDTDRAAVVRALDEAERLARASLGDLRGTVRLLSEDGDPRLEPPIALASDLAELVDGYRRTGVAIEFHTHGDAPELSVATAWALYRIVQESLTNAARHAQGADASVVLTWGGDGVKVEVSNGLGLPAQVTMAEATTGRGVVGMSERVALLGGRLEAGPTSSGWNVSAWVPVAQFSEVATR